MIYFLIKIGILYLILIQGFVICHWGQGWVQQNNNGAGQNGFNHGQGHNQYHPGLHCSRPVFDDESELIIEKCKTEKFHELCSNSEINIPAGWKVFMSCKKGRKRYLYPTTCSQSGDWTPQMYSNCEELLRMFPQIGRNPQNNNPINAYFAPSSTEGNSEDFDITTSTTTERMLRQCPMMYLQVTENFEFSCLLPEGTIVENCLTSLKYVPSGTKTFLKCKPPFYSTDGKNSEWICSDSTWRGDFSHKLRCYFSSIGKVNGGANTRTTTTRPKKPFTTMTTTARTTRRTTTTHTTTTTEDNTLIDDPFGSISSEKTCPPLHSRSAGVELECVSKSSLSGTISLNDCNISQPVGAEAKYSCREYYESTAGLVTIYRKCREDGTWTGSSENFHCVIQCGRNNVVFVPLITSGSPTIRGQWPWHSALFLKETVSETEHNKWTYVCGGTLISKNAVATAAHCVTFSQSSRVRQASHFRIDLGRFEREGNDDIVQGKDVSSVHVHPSYSPYGYDSDIAVIILKESASIGYHVRPICFPQTLNSALEELQVADNSLGTVAGWGYNEKGILADNLQMAQLKVASQRDCSDSVRGFETGSIQAKSTTFCAKSKNGTDDINVCNGDSGGGMYFPLKNSDFTRWYLQGIVSVGFADDAGKCKPSQYSIFTRVGRYADWIVRVLSENDSL